MAFHQSLGPGQIAGLPAALNGTYNLTATAAEDCEMGYLPTEIFLDIIEYEACVSRMVMAQVSRELLRIRALTLCCRYQAMPREQRTGRRAGDEAACLSAAPEQQAKLQYA